MNERLGLGAMIEHILRDPRLREMMRQGPGMAPAYPPEPDPLLMRLLDGGRVAQGFGALHDK